MATTTTATPRLKQRFESELKAQLQNELGLTNVMQVPQPVKIVVNMGVGRATQQRSLLDGAVTDLTIITGQKPLVTKAKKSIANFKLREGNEIGAKVTLRGDRMWEFYDRLVSLAIRASATSAVCHPSNSTDTGTTRSGSTSSSCSPRSTTTRSTAFAA